ncbi:MAG: hypothetical protein ACHQHP_03175 [Bacteroidia bacterium]
MNAQSYLCFMLGIILAIIYTILFVFLIRKLKFFQTEGISRRTFVFAFLVKIIFGFIFWAVYTYHVPYQQRADAFLYFDDGKAIYKALFEQPVSYFKILFGFNDTSLGHYIDQTGHWKMAYVQGLYNETRTVIRFNAIVDIFSFGNYHVHTVFLCFLSMIGLMGVYKTFVPFLSTKKKELFVIVFFLPSVLFWGSGVLKEGLILFSMGMLIYHYHKVVSEKISITRIILVFLFAGLLCITKIYILMILVPVFIAHLWIVKTGMRKPEIKYLIVFTVFISIGFLQKKYDLPFMLMDKQRQSIYMASGGSYLGIVDKDKFIYIKPEIKNRIIPLPEKPGYCKIAPGVPYVSWYFNEYNDSTYVRHSADTTTYWVYYDLAEAGSKIDIPLLYPSWMSILKNSPFAFVNTAFRPFIFEAKNPLMILSAIENLFIVAFILICIFFFSKKIQNRHLICFCASFVILLFILIGLTTPILGAVVRYKIPALPFLLIAFLFILDKEKLLRRFPWLKKIID